MSLSPNCYYRTWNSTVDQILQQLCNLVQCPPELGGFDNIHSNLDAAQQTIRKCLTDSTGAIEIALLIRDISTPLFAVRAVNRPSSYIPIRFFFHYTTKTPTQKIRDQVGQHTPKSSKPYNQITVAIQMILKTRLATYPALAVR